jgi:hypothetical protein
MGNPDDLKRQEQALADQIQRLGPHHADTGLTRDSLAIRYRNAGRNDLADALYAGDLGICEHLRPVLEYLRSQGVSIYSVGTPWSTNCRTWVYFKDVILDPDALKKRLALPAVVQSHSHRGTHEGSEQGLVCREHHDALMGAHPEVAPAARVIT